MSLLNKLFESSNTSQARLVNKKQDKDNTNQSNNTEQSNSSLLEDSHRILGLPLYSTWELVSKLRQVNDAYKVMLTEYDAMDDEVIIQAALELYADNATQVDSKTGKVVTITTEDESLQSELNDLMDILDIDKRVWNWSYNLAKYGDVYSRVISLDKLEEKLKTLNSNTDDNIQLKSIESMNEQGSTDFILEDVIDGSVILDLYEYGQRVGFAEEDTSEYSHLKVKQNKGLDLILHSPNSFIHFTLSRTSQYEFLELLDHSHKDEYGDPLVRKYTVQRGMSMLEGVRAIYRILQLLEDSLLAARIAKAEFIRVYNIEVGQSTPEKTTQIVNAVKNEFDARVTFDPKTGRYESSKAIRPIGDGIFNPTREGSGSISVETIGGDIQVKDIADMEYFNNKLFAGLKIPKSLLGFEESISYGSNDAMTQLDIRLGRSIKRIQLGLINGIRDICRIYIEATGREYVEESIQVNLQSPSSAEELDRLNEFQSRLAVVDSTIQSLQQALGEHMNLAKVYNILLKRMANYPDLIEELQPEFKKAIKSYQDKLDNPPEDEDM